MWRFFFFLSVRSLDLKLLLLSLVLVVAVLFTVKSGDSLLEEDLNING